MATTVINALSGGAGQFVLGLIDRIRGKSPEDAAKLQQLLAGYDHEAAMAELDYRKALLASDTAANQTAGDTIKTELASPDGWVRRAPVATIWLGFFVGLWNWVVLPTVHIWVLGAIPFNLPTAFWYLWAVAIIGFVGGNAALRALAGAGGSLNLLGMKMDSKGD